MYPISGYLFHCLSEDQISSYLNKRISNSINTDFTPINHVVNHYNGSSLIVSHESDLYFNDHLTAVIAGNAYWSHNDLANLANNMGNAQALGEAYYQYGDNLLKYIKGSYALVIIDKKNNRQLLAIDKLGIQSLYYMHQSDSKVVFATHLNGIVDFPNLKFELDNQAIYNYVYFHMVPSPGTIYKGINKLLPGQILKVEDGQVTTEFHWKPTFNTDHNSSPNTLKSELRQLLNDAVSRCSPNEKTGAFLSGGLDSSTVVGYMSQFSKASKAYSIGFDAKGFDEIQFARISAKHFTTPLVEYYVTPKDVWGSAEKIAAFYQEPFGNASAIPTYHCARLAKSDGMDCLLAGDGGDELFAGNSRYAKQKIFELYSRLPSAIKSLMIEPFVFGFPLGEKVFPIRKTRRYIEQAKIPLPARLESYNFLERVPIENVFSQEFLSNVSTTNPHEALLETYNRTDTRDSLDKMLYLDWKFTLADNDLQKVNHMCQLAGMEVRYPMLDDDLLEFSTTIPPNLKLKGTQLRYFYKSALRDFLPEQCLTKSKHGFGLPFGVWLKTDPQLKELARQNLTAMKQRHIFHEAFIDQLIEEHRQGHASYYGEMIWVILMLELWLSSHGF